MSIMELELLDTEDMEQSEFQQKETFKVKDLDGANWCLRKLSELNKQDAEIKALADSEHDRIETWYGKETKKSKNSREFFESLLTQYYMEEKAKDSKFKISTPYGKVSSRKVAEKYIYDDEKLVIWTKANKPDLIRTKEEVKKDELKKVLKTVGQIALDENGEIVDGIAIQPAGEKVVISVE